jgi:hypothetical protein
MYATSVNVVWELVRTLSDETKPTVCLAQQAEIGKQQQSSGILYFS